MDNKCTFCNMVCTEADAAQGKCIIIGEKKACGKCLGHLKAGLASSGKN